MELEQFIEEDIKAFLDREQANPSVPKALMPNVSASAAPTQQPTPAPADLPIPVRDYSAELEKALTANDLAAAKRTLQDLKETFDKVPSGSPSKTGLQRLLEQLNDRFKEWLAKRHEATKSALRPASPLSPQRADSHKADAHPHTRPGSSTTSTEHLKQQERQQEQERKQEQERLKRHMEQTRTLVAKGAYAEAMLLYRQLRRAIGALPPSLQGTLLDDARVLYEEIEKRLGFGKRTPAILSEFSTYPVHGFRDHLQAADRALAAGEYADAVEQYKRLRALFPLLAGTERDRFADRLDELYHHLKEALKPDASSVHDEQSSGAAEHERAREKTRDGAQVLLKAAEQRLIGKP